MAQVPCFCINLPAADFEKSGSDVWGEFHQSLRPSFSSSADFLSKSPCTRNAWVKQKMKTHRVDMAPCMVF